MEHVCSPECKRMLDDAALGLEDATRALRMSLLASSEELIWGSYARVRAAKAKLRGAMEDYQEHVLESDCPLTPMADGQSQRERTLRAFVV